MSAFETRFSPHLRPAVITATPGLNGISLLEFTLTKNAPVSPLECALTKSLDLKSFRIRTYKKRGGGEVILGRAGQPFSEVCAVKQVFPVGTLVPWNGRWRQVAWQSTRVAPQ